MDVRDLKIGDFVSWKDERCEILVIAADQVAIRIGRRYKYNPTDISDIQPISITDALLEKIGFKNKIKANHSLGYRLVLDEGNILIWHEYKTGKYIISILDNKSSVILAGKCISYLHQLQHELHDAGIGIKIELDEKKI